MSTLLLTAALSLILLALVHSVLGEVLLLRHMKSVAGVPVVWGSDRLLKQTMRATWHIPSILGCGLAVILARYARIERGDAEQFVITTISVALLACGAAVLVGTRGKHPGWAAFVAVAALCWMAT